MKGIYVGGNLPKNFAFFCDFTVSVFIQNEFFTVSYYKHLLRFVIFTRIYQIKKVFLSPSDFQIPVIAIKCHLDKNLNYMTETIKRKPALMNYFIKLWNIYLMMTSLETVGAWTFWSETMWAPIDFCWYNNNLFNDRCFQSGSPQSPLCFLVWIKNIELHNTIS